MPFGTLYGLAAEARNRLYDLGILPSYPLGARTISIGNLTAGGTGKTPLVALTAKLLAENGEKACVLTRGYGRANEAQFVVVSDGEKVLADAAAGGDEPVELAWSLLGQAAVVADANRVAAAELARKRFGTTAFILDDGFQHRRARRDLDIVCIDAMNPFGGGMIPAGTARERAAGLGRADIVILTRTNLVDSTDTLCENIFQLAPKAVMLRSSTKIGGLVRLEKFSCGQRVRAAEVFQRPERPFAFCGLGNPENFRKQLLADHFELAGFIPFSDHHRYCQSDIEAIEKKAVKCYAESLITTGKDAVKLTGLNFNLPVWVAEASVELDDEKTFQQMVLG